jgi:translation initiation factor 2 subunit 1
MLYTKDGFPEVNEIVKCTVKTISSDNVVFVSVDEYEKEGILTIQEIAPGRIRNLRDHVMEGKVIICKVIRVDLKQKRIDVSLRRVNVQARKEKLEEIKKEEFSEKFYIDAGKILNMSKDDLFEKTYEVIFDKYDSVFEALYDVMLNNEKVEMFKNLNKEQQQKFLEIINDRIKPEKITIKREFFISSDDMDGLKKIKDSISKALDFIKHKDSFVTYLAASHYLICITEDDMKSAIKVYKSFSNELEKLSKQNKLKLEFKNKD